MTQDNCTAEIRTVAAAICKSRTCEGMNCCQWPAQIGRLNCPVMRGGYDDAARAAIAAVSALQRTVPDGWQLVPKELTEDMANEMECAWGTEEQWERALKAAPVLADQRGG